MTGSITYFAASSRFPKSSMDENTISSASILRAIAQRSILSLVEVQEFGWSMDLIWKITLLTQEISLYQIGSKTARAQLIGNPEKFPSN